MSKYIHKTENKVIFFNVCQKKGIKTHLRSFQFREQIKHYEIIYDCNGHRAAFTHLLEKNQILPLSSLQPILFQPVHLFCAQSAMIKDEWLDLKAC